MGQTLKRPHSKKKKNPSTPEAETGGALNPRPALTPNDPRLEQAGPGGLGRLGREAPARFEAAWDTGGGEKPHDNEEPAASFSNVNQWKTMEYVHPSSPRGTARFPARTSSDAAGPPSARHPQPGPQQRPRRPTPAPPRPARPARPARPGPLTRGSSSSLARGAAAPAPVRLGAAAGTGMRRAVRG